MNGIVLYGIGSPLVVEYVEACARLGMPIVAAVRNWPGEHFFGDAGAVVDAAAIDERLARTPCICPMFTPGNRRAACADAQRRGFPFADPLIHPSAIVARSVHIGEGSFVNAGSIIGAETRLSRHAVVNRGASLAHHVALAEFVSIGPGAVVAGQVTIEAGAMIGAAAVLLPRVRIGANAIVAAGAVVVRDVPPGATIAGNPAEQIG